MIFSQPNLVEEDYRYVDKCLREGHLVTGVIAEEFENMFTEAFGYPHVVVTNSGTSAMHLGLLAMDIGPGDEVIVTPYSMVATVNVILAVGATPVFCDVERDTYNLDPELLPDLITEKTKAILPASIFGVPCNVPRMRELIPDHVKILEDSIEALGALRNGAFLGLDADAAAFGFFPNKQITTCEGGVLFSKNKELIDRVRRLSRHGVMAGDLSYQSMGYNMRLSDLHCALGVAQLKRLPELQGALLMAKDLLDKYFRDYRKQVTPEWAKSSEFIYGIELPDGVDKEQFMKDMGKQGIPVKPYFNVLHKFAHLEPYTAELPVAEEIGSKTVALPFHYALTEGDVEEIWEAFVTVLGDDNV